MAQRGVQQGQEDAGRAVRLQNYIGGKWVASAGASLPVENPATGDLLAEVPLSTEGDLNRAVVLARGAFLSWREVPPAKRVQPLFRLKGLLEEHQEDIARILTEEHGKILRESLLEVQRAIENVEVASGIPTLMQGEVLKDNSEGIDEQSIREPVGVFAVIAPFNFPAMIPFWFLPYAVACGNSCIVKPSEQVPLTQQRIFELIDQAGFPPGVASLVHGDSTIARALVEHPGIAGISSVTSTPIAREIYASAARQGKRVQCQAGAKNFAVVMPDADLEAAIPSILSAAYGSTGQRCLALANIISVGEAHEGVRERLLAAAQKIKVGNGLDEGVMMGPVISAAAKGRIERSIAKGIEEGAELLLDGRGIRIPGHAGGHFIGPCIFDNVRPEQGIAREEIFGPVVCLLRAESLAEAVEMINGLPFGNAAVIYTQSGRNARAFQQVDCGNIGVNVGVAAPVACFPFSGMKDSFFGDIHGQSDRVIDFFTHRKVVVMRW